MKKRRGFINKALRVTAWSLGLVIVLISVGVGLLHTSWGRTWIKQKIISIAEESINGKVGIGDIDGFLLGKPEIKNISILDDRNEPIITVVSIAVDYNLFSLLSKTFHAHEVKITNPMSYIRKATDDSPTIGNLVKEQDQATSGKSSDWEILIDKLLVLNGHIDATLADHSAFKISNIQLQLQAKMGQASTHIKLNRLAAHLDSQNRELSAEASLFYSDASLRIEELSLKVGVSFVHVDKFTLLPDGNLTAGFSIYVSGKEARLISPNIDFGQGVEIRGSFFRESNASSLNVRIHGKLASATITSNLSLNPSLTEMMGSIAFDHLNPKVFHSSAPSGLIHSVSQVKFSWADLGIRGDIHGEFRGIVGRTPIKSCAYRVQFDDEKRLKGDISLKTPQGEILADASLFLGRTPIVIEHAQIKGDFANLDLWEISSATKFDLSVKGPLDNAAVNGNLALKNLSFGKSRVRSVQAEVSITGLPARAEGHATFLVTGMQLENHVIGSLKGSARARNQGRNIKVYFRSPNETNPYGLNGLLRIVHSPNKTELTVDNLTIKTNNIVWSGKSARVVWGADGALQADKIVLSSKAGRISASFDRHLISGREESLSAHVRADDLNLKKIQQMIPSGFLPSLCGNLNLNVNVSKTAKRFRVDGSSFVKGYCVIARSPSLDGNVRATLVDNELIFEVSAKDSKIGRLTASAKILAPSKPFDIQGWVRQGSSRIKILKTQLADIDLKSIASLLGYSGLEGNLAGEVSFEDNLEKGIVSLQIERLGIESVADGVKADLHATLSAKQLTISLNAKDKYDGVLNVSSRLQPPDWKSFSENGLNFDLENLMSFDASLEQVQISKFMRFFHQAPPMVGVINAEVDYTDKDPVARVRLGISNIRIAGIAGESAANITANFGNKKSELTLTTSLDGKKTAMAQASIGVGYRDLFMQGLDCLPTASLEGNIEIDHLPLRKLFDVFSLKIPIEGALVAQAWMKGTLKQPYLKLESNLDGAQIGKLRFDVLGLSTETLHNGYGVSLHGRQANGGTFELDTRLDSSTLTPTDLKFIAGDFRIRPVMLVARPLIRTPIDIDGVLDAELRWTQNQRQIPLAGWIQMRRGELSLPAGLRTLKNLEVEAKIQNEWIQIDGTAHSGAGHITIAADVDASQWPPVSASMDLSMQRFPLPAGGAMIGVDLAARLEVDRDNVLWKTMSRIRRATVYLSQNNEASLHDTTPLEDVVWFGASLEESEPAEKPSKPNMKPEFAARMKIRSDEPVIVRNQDIEAQLSIDLDASLVGGSIAITGNVEVTDGHALIFDRQYQITNGKAAFKGAMPPDPHIDLVLTHDLGALKLVISVQGTAKRPKVILSSDPAIYDKSQLLTFVLGRNPEDPLRDTKSMEDRALNVASGLLLSKVQSEVKQALLIDTLRLETEQKQGKTVRRVIVGKWVTEDVFIAYRYRLGSGENENVNEANVSYRLARDWVLEGTYGDSGKGGVDILWVKRF